MANGTSRLVLAQAQLKRESQSRLNTSFKNESDVGKATRKVPLKYPTKSNRSK